jgi:hypothetical protein
MSLADGIRSVSPVAIRAPRRRGKRQVRERKADDRQMRTRQIRSSAAPEATSVARTYTVLLYRGTRREWNADRRCHRRGSYPREPVSTALHSPGTTRAASRSPCGMSARSRPAPTMNKHASCFVLRHNTLGEGHPGSRSRSRTQKPWCAHSSSSTTWTHSSTDLPRAYGGQPWPAGTGAGADS